MWHHWHWHHMMLMAPQRVPLNSLGATWLFHHVMPSNQHHIMPIAQCMAHDTVARTGTITGTNSHTLPLNIHLNKTNAIVSLMASCDKKHPTPFYMPKLICSSNATYKPHIPISSCAHVRHLCQYTCLIWTHCNQQCEQEHWYTYLSHYWHMPQNKYASHCITTLAYRPHITGYLKS